MQVLITGATGFVGSALTKELVRQGYRVRAAVRNPDAIMPAEVERYIIGDFSTETNWNQALQGVDAIVHCAARVHIMEETATDSLNAFRHINVGATLNLAGQAADAGIKRFVFLSTIKVNGELTPPNQPFTADDFPAPEDAYGQSKLEAERGLLTLSKMTPLEVVIIRPPLIYGPGVKGNFQTLVNWLKKGWPLPLGAVNNRRSLLALDNLVSFILCGLEHPQAANQVFLLADGEDVSTTQLLQKISAALGKPARLWPIPVCCLNRLAKLFGKQHKATRLLGWLQVDNSKALMLGWRPTVSMDEALRKSL